MAYDKGSEADKTDPRKLAPPETLDIDEQTKEDTTSQIHKPVVNNAV
jgi:hypothetical protein